MGITAKRGLGLFIMFLLFLVVAISSTPHVSGIEVKRFGAGGGGGGRGGGGGGGGRSGGGSRGRVPVIIGGAAGAAAAASHHGGHRSSGHRPSGGTAQMLLCGCFGLLLGVNVWM